MPRRPCASEKRFRTLIQFSFDVYWKRCAASRHAAGVRRSLRRSADPRPRSEGALGSPLCRAWRGRLARASRHARCAPAVSRFRARAPRRTAADAITPSWGYRCSTKGRFIGYRGVRPTSPIASGSSRRSARTRRTWPRRSDSRTREAGPSRRDARRHLLVGRDVPHLRHGIRGEASARHERGADPSSINPVDDERFWSIFQKRRETKADVEMERRIVLEGGTMKHLHVIGRSVLDQTGGRGYVTVVERTPSATHRGRACRPRCGFSRAWTGSTAPCRRAPIRSS